MTGLKPRPQLTHQAAALEAVYSYLQSLDGAKTLFKSLEGLSPIQSLWIPDEYDEMTPAARFSLYIVIPEKTEGSEGRMTSPTLSRVVHFGYVSLTPRQPAPGALDLSELLLCWTAA